MLAAEARPNCGGNDDVAAVSVVMVKDWIQWTVDGGGGD